MPKIFIIGLPRTGTTSICAALLTLNYKVAHTAYCQATFEQAEVIADTPIFADFQLLDKAYPNSQFIYLTRSLPLWIPSIKQLLQRMSVNVLRDDGGFNPIIKRCYQKIFYPFTTENIADDNFLTHCYLSHQHTVFEYFSASPQQLLTIDVSDKKAYQEMIDFLNHNNLQTDNGSFLQMNIGGKITAWKEISHPNKIASTRKGKASKLDYLGCER